MEGKMQKIEELFEYLKNNSGEQFKSSEIRMLEPSFRSYLSDLYKAGYLERISRGVYVASPKLRMASLEELKKTLASQANERRLRAKREPKEEILEVDALELMSQLSQDEILNLISTFVSKLKVDNTFLTDQISTLKKVIEARDLEISQLREQLKEERVSLQTLRAEHAKLGAYQKAQVVERYIVIDRAGHAQKQHGGSGIPGVCTGTAL